MIMWCVISCISIVITKPDDTFELLKQKSYSVPLRSNEQKYVVVNDVESQHFKMAGNENV